MSTFDGILEEFPYITIDYFRKSPERPPPLACFLSHAHSDHLQGLESFRAPFIYCSAATRELLLRIEKYPHRMNFNNGILESRRLHYKHLSKLLRPIPLNTPTEIDLTPRLSIRVTLLDANHCTGAVMFLIEGDRKAILYTGDIRAESWWVDSLIRHPILIPYTLGNKRLDRLYLDTTFAHTLRSFHTFPTKAEGLAELLRKLEPYPDDTTFYFRAWTFGYEEVWMAIAAALKSKVHVDRYQMGLYRSVSSSNKEGSGAAEVPSLCGFELGNRIVPGFLSEDERSRIHSCEPGVHCSVVSSKKTVYITPIVSRTRNGSEVPELGAGGGLGDLYQSHELELPDQSALSQLEQLCREKIHEPQAYSRARDALAEAFRSKSKALSLDSYGIKDSNEMPLGDLVDILSRGRQSEEPILSENAETSTRILDRFGNNLPRTIHFPYSRHSSYSELCELVAAFKPRDIYPCTVDPSDWDEDISMQSLFGHLCSGDKFVHDRYMRDIAAAENGGRPRKRARHAPESSTQSTQQSTVATADDDSQLRSHPFTSGPPVSKPVIIASSSPPRSSERTVLLSPLATNDEENPTNTSSSNSLHQPTPSPETAKAKRNAIRQAWSLLHEARKSNPNQFDLGSLPSSWPTDRNSHPHHDPLDLRMAGPQALDRQSPSASQITAIHVPDAQPTRDTAAGGQERKPTRTTAEHITSAKGDMTIEAGTDYVVETVTDAESQADRQSDSYPLSQQSHAPTISSSTFASQVESQNPLRRDQLGNEHDLTTDEEPLTEFEYEQQPQPQQASPTDGMTNPRIASSDSRTQPVPWGSIRRQSSIRNRRAAYLAAREDSYDAWASISLTSAGNNLTEEEVEL
ncbi:hypothetical protein BJX61DRAFT_304200 [Aspergillus egyptiacus]|nr:hypothetical protein BJX61DRAFT_304200 [Aspergillus egyptiacus]